MLFLRWYLWIAPNFLLLLCIIGCVRRRLYKRYQPFFSYITYELIAFLVLLTADIVPSQIVQLTNYRWILAVSSGLTSMFQLWLLYALGNDLWWSRPTLSHAVRPLVRWSLALIILFAAFSSALLSKPGLERVASAFQFLDFSGNLISVGMLMALLLFTRALSISWRSLPAGIGLGLGISGTAEIAAAPLYAALGHDYYIRLDILRMSAFQVCVVIWLIYIFMPSRPPGFTGHRPDRTDLEAWDEELQKIVR